MKPYEFKFCKTQSDAFLMRRCEYKIGDIVKVKHFGACYYTYNSAFVQLNVLNYHFANYHFDNTQASTLGLNDLQEDILKNTNWVILDICLHTLSPYDTMYLIGNPILRCGLLIGERGITLIHSGKIKISKKYIWTEFH